MDKTVIGHDSVAECDALKLSVDVCELGITAQASTRPIICDRLVGLSSS